jgi:two-component system cell cycle response regulator
MAPKRIDGDSDFGSDLTEPGRVSPLSPSQDAGIYPTEDKIVASLAPVCDRPTLTMITGSQAGSILTLERQETLLGRASECHVQVEDLGASRRHARISRMPDGSFTLEDLGSRNGTTVHGLPIQTHSLADGDRVGLGPSVFMRFAFTDQTEEELLRRLYTSSIVDALTGALNRTHLLERLSAELAFARRHKTPLSLLLIDLDHFKRVNDTLGHLAGDQVLREACALVRSTLRAEDIFARYGGEEFVIVARGIGVDHAVLFADRIRQVVANASFAFEGHPIQVTFSIGVASLSCCVPGAGMRELVELADLRLYEAKRRGRNCTVGAKPGGP